MGKKLAKENYYLTQQKCEPSAEPVKNQAT
jgi:hypothetical protein